MGLAPFPNDKYMSCVVKKIWVLLDPCVPSYMTVSKLLAFSLAWLSHLLTGNKNTCRER